MGRIVILSGPSGVGKDTLLIEWMAANEDVIKVVTYTTRAPRVGEVNGVDYHFVDRDTFMAMAEAGEFLEWKEVYGNFYATPLRDIEGLIGAGKIAVLKIDVQGALDVMQLCPDALTIFIDAPSWEELERRIRDRGQDAAEAIERRLKTATLELESAAQYQHRVVNASVPEAVAELQRIVTAT